MKKTCVPLWRETFGRFVKTDADKKAFVAGFLTGLCEKVALGSCRAAMSRPDKQDFDWEKVTLDPGHKYALNHLDGSGSEVLTFVKRDSPVIINLTIQEVCELIVALASRSIRYTLDTTSNLNYGRNNHA